MNLQESTTIVLTFVAGFGGGGAIAFALIKWFGEILANKYVEKVKHDFEQDLERHKTQLRKSEFLFQKEFEAASAFISLHLELIPPYHRIPEMDWHDACEAFALEFEQVENALNSYIATHGAALKSETLERLTNTKSLASNSQLQLEASNFNVSEGGRRSAEKVMNDLKKIEKELYQTVWSQSST